MGFREEVEEMKHEIEKAIDEEKTFAMELLSDSRRQNKRNFILIIVLIIALFGSNMAWLWYESQFTYLSESEEQEINFTEDSTITQNINK